MPELRFEGVVESLSDVNEDSSDAIRISVITVVFNGGAVLRKTIESVLSQETGCSEYIVIDGASRDGTLEIIKEYKSRISACVSEKDRGIYDAMNKGLSMARGKYVYFLNAGDTFLDDGVLSRATEYLRDEPSVLVGSVLVDSRIKGIDRYPVGFELGMKARQAFDSHLCHQACFVNRQALLAVGVFNLSYPHFADFHSTWRVMSKGTVKVVPGFAIAEFGLDGISSDWRRAVRLYKEKELVLTALGDEKNVVRYFAGLVKASMYFMRKWFSEKLA